MLGRNQFGTHSVPNSEIAEIATNAAEKQITRKSFKAYSTSTVQLKASSIFADSANGSFGLRLQSVNATPKL